MTTPPQKASDKFKDTDKEWYGEPGPGNDPDERAVLLELRSTGGQTIVAPSAHEGTGEAIVWHVFTEPARVALDELRAACDQLAAASVLARHWPPRGGRHDLALALAGGVLRAGWSVEKAQRFLRVVFVAAETGDVETKIKAVEDSAEKIKAGENVTGWPSAAAALRGDGQAVVTQVCRWLDVPQQTSARPAQRPRQISPYVPFPVDALPPVVKEFVCQGAAALGCDPAFFALHALAAIAAAISNTRTIQLKRGWTEPSVVWVLVIAESGTLKRPAWRKVMAHLFRVQRRLLREHREEMVRYEADLETFQENKKKAMKGGGSAGTPPEKPIQRRMALFYDPNFSNP